MKELDLTNSEALDAGWDADEKDPAVSVAQPKTAFSTAVAGDFDAGWDSTPQNPEVQLQPRTEKKALQAAPQASDNAAPVARPLTKKDRRDIERQQRVHAAQKQTQSKSEKKRQRKQVATAQGTPVVHASPAAAVSSPNGASKQRRKAKPRAEQRRQPRADAKPQAQRAVISESRRPKPHQAPTATAAIDSTSPASQKKSSLPMYFAIGLVLLSLALLWHFGGRR